MHDPTCPGGHVPGRPHAREVHCGLRFLGARLGAPCPRSGRKEERQAEPHARLDTPPATPPPPAQGRLGC